MVRSESKQKDQSVWHDDDATTRQDVSTQFRILIEFETTEYSYSIRFVFEISRIFYSIFDLNEISDSSRPYWQDILCVK